MSKMAMIRRVHGVGDPALPIAALLGKGAALIGGLFKKKAATTALATITKAAPAAAAKAAVLGGGFAGGQQLVSQLWPGYGKAVGVNGAPRRRRAKGLTGAELRGFRKTCNLLRRVGMYPKALRRAPSKRRVC